MCQNPQVERQGDVADEGTRIADTMKLLREKQQRLVDELHTLANAMLRSGGRRAQPRVMLAAQTCVEHGNPELAAALLLSSSTSTQCTNMKETVPHPHTVPPQISVLTSEQFVAHRSHASRIF